MAFADWPPDFRSGEIIGKSANKNKGTRAEQQMMKARLTEQ
jgi:hypothetical protein